MLVVFYLVVVLKLSGIKCGFAEFIPKCFTICNPNNSLRLVVTIKIKRNKRK